ncbi:unnamed protein product [Blepharisma stoltei]|uniref:MOSC domain-containing protein n=1 Tax=Blepharisma stoltei TaxID=1481888 RepID=A0AAU9JFD7_9CILI|nr:unnamed protein product [Blepharisma stoltei]
MDWWVWATIISILAVFYIVKKRRTIIVTDIIFYPIKSCQGIHLNIAEIGESGIVMDREWAILDEKDNIVDQKLNPNLARLKPSIINDKDSCPQFLVLSYPKFQDFALKINENKVSSIFEVDLEEMKGEVLDEGPEVARWLSEVFGKDYRLCKLIRQRDLSDHPNYGNLEEGEFKLSFNCEGQFLITSEESLQYMLQSLSEDKRGLFDMDSFRPNIVVKNCQPFEEDNWGNFEIDGVKFSGVRLCDRCRMTTMHKDTLQQDPKFEPVTTMRRIHGSGIKAFFGLLAVKRNTGIIRKNSVLTVKSIQKRTDASVSPFK